MHVALPKLLVWSLPMMSLSLLAIAIGFIGKLHMGLENYPQAPSALVEAEAQKLLQQAQKDVQSPETACFGQSMICAFDHYEFDATVRLAALEKLQTNPPSARNP